MSETEQIVYFQVKANFPQVSEEERLEVLDRIASSEHYGARQAAKEIRQELYA